MFFFASHFSQEHVLPLAQELNTIFISPSRMLKFHHQRFIKIPDT